MKCTIEPALNRLRFEELVLEVAPGTLPPDGDRAILSITWDGEIGIVKYASAVEGRIDNTYFRDPAVLKPYLSPFRDAAIAAFDIEQTKLDEKGADPVPIDPVPVDDPAAIK
jgi:hypothetical protein